MSEDPSPRSNKQEPMGSTNKGAQADMGLPMGTWKAAIKGHRQTLWPPCGQGNRFTASIDFADGHQHVQLGLLWVGFLRTQEVYS